jgi:hypothetical protein
VAQLKFNADCVVLSACNAIADEMNSAPTLSNARRNAATVEGCATIMPIWNEHLRHGRQPRHDRSGLIELQIGGCLGDDDIVRIEDDYHRS